MASFLSDGAIDQSEDIMWPRNRTEQKNHMVRRSTLKLYFKRPGHFIYRIEIEKGNSICGLPICHYQGNYGKGNQCRKLLYRVDPFAQMYDRNA